jgi:uncharacterized protein
MKPRIGATERESDRYGNASERSVAEPQRFRNPESKIHCRPCLPALLLLLPLLACRPAAKPAPAANSAPPSLKRQMLIAGRDTAYVEVAATEESRAVGLMFRSVMAENEGMLFVFDSDGIYPFWMKNTELPLSIAFIDRNGIITDIEDMAPHDEISHHAPHVPILYALEMNQDWFQRHHVGVGDSVRPLPAKP